MTAPRRQPPITMREAEKLLAQIQQQLELLHANTNDRKGQFEADLTCAMTYTRLARQRLSDRIFAQLRTDSDKELHKC